MRTFRERLLNPLVGVVVLTVALTFSFSPGKAFAVAMLDFAGIGMQGTISQSLDVVTGENILINFLNVTGAPLNNNLFQVENGRLDFIKSNAGSALSIRGSIPDLGINDITQLVGGEIQAAGFFGDTTFNFNGGDRKNPILLEALGLDPNTPFTFAGSSVGAPQADGSINVASTNFFNTEGANPAIPEPTSILLLGSGMIGLGAWQWRRNKKNQKAA